MGHDQQRRPRDFYHTGGGTPRLHIHMYTQHMYLIICVRTHMYVRTVHMYGCMSIGQWNEKIMKLGQHFCSSQASTNTTSTHQLLGVLIPHNVNTSQMVIRLGLAISWARERERESGGCPPTMPCWGLRMSRKSENSWQKRQVGA